MFRFQLLRNEKCCFFARNGKLRHATYIFGRRMFIFVGVRHGRPTSFPKCEKIKLFLSFFLRMYKSEVWPKEREDEANFSKFSLLSFLHLEHVSRQWERTDSISSCVRGEFLHQVLIALCAQKCVWNNLSLFFFTFPRKPWKCWKLASFSRFSSLNFHFILDFSPLFSFSVTSLLIFSDKTEWQ